MHVRSVISTVLLTVLLAPIARAVDHAPTVLSMAEQIFGAPLNLHHAVFRLNDTYVLWLIIDVKGNLEEVDIGPRSYYSSEFPNARGAPEPEHLSVADYQDALQRIRQVKDIGSLQQSHGSSTIVTDLGRVNTDRFEYAFVDRIVGEDNEVVRRFDIYFLHDMAGSPEQVLTMNEQPMVCFVGLWYYMAPEDTNRIKVGTWQKLRVAGPNLQGTTGCFRKVVLHDADGFTIEEPQNETIVLADIQCTSSGRASAHRQHRGGRCQRRIQAEREQRGIKDENKGKRNLRLLRYS